MELVSVIIPIYNSSLHIKECLDSVINQTYDKLEIIIVDDCSLDDSLKIVNSFKDKRIKIIKLKRHSGVATARNKGVSISSGKYICFLDSDDYWDLEKVEKQVNFMKSNNYSFIFSDYYFLRKGKKHRARTPKSLNYVQALKNTTIFTSTVMFNTNLLNKESIVMPDFKIGQDTACWWSILNRGIVAYSINEPLATYRVRDAFISLYRFKRVLGAWRIYKSQDISWLRRIYCFIYHLFNAIKRRIF